MESDRQAFSEDLFASPVERPTRIRRRRILEDFVEGEKLHFSVCSIGSHLLGLNGIFYTVIYAGVTSPEESPPVSGKSFKWKHTFPCDT